MSKKFDGMKCQFQLGTIRFCEGKRRKNAERRREFPHIDGNKKPIGGMEPTRDNNDPGPTNARIDKFDYANEFIKIMKFPTDHTGDNYKFDL